MKQKEKKHRGVNKYYKK